MAIWFLATHAAKWPDNVAKLRQICFFNSKDGAGDWYTLESPITKAKVSSQVVTNTTMRSIWALARFLYQAASRRTVMLQEYRPEACSSAVPYGERSRMHSPLISNGIRHWRLRHFHKLSQLYQCIHAVRFLPARQRGASRPDGAHTGPQAGRLPRSPFLFPTKEVSCR